MYNKLWKEISLQQSSAYRIYEQANSFLWTYYIFRIVYHRYHYKIITNYMTKVLVTFGLLIFLFTYDRKLWCHWEALCIIPIIYGVSGKSTHWNLGKNSWISVEAGVNRVISYVCFFWKQLKLPLELKVHWKLMELRIVKFWWSAFLVCNVPLLTQTDYC